VGLLAFLSGIDRRIFDDVYVPLGDVWDAAVIVNSAVNFILTISGAPLLITLTPAPITTPAPTRTPVSTSALVNFILYCTMSAQFRCTFAEVICRRKPRTWNWMSYRLKHNKG